MITRRIGIDFGTSTTIMMYKDYNDGEPMDNRNPVIITDDGVDTIPTVVRKVAGGETLFGKQAEDSEENGEVYVNFKMDLASEGEQYQQALALTEEFFKYLRELYEAYLVDGEECDREETWISYPAKWKPEVIEDMKQTARIAGFDNVAGMDEPTAAVNSLVYQNQGSLQKQGMLDVNRDNNVLVIDMGAGTMDLVFCKYRPGADKPLDVLLSWPNAQSENFFGGREIDEKLAEQSIMYLLQNGQDYSNMKGSLLRKNKKWKEGLSKKLNNNGSFSGAPSFIQEILRKDSDSMKDYPVLDRLGFEQACGELLRVFPEMVYECGEALEEQKGINLFEETDLIILTGGNSIWYFIEEYLTGRRPSGYVPIEFKKIMVKGEQGDQWRIFRMKKPQQTVAYGLTLNKEMVRQVSEKLSKGDSATQSVSRGMGSILPVDIKTADIVSAQQDMDATKEREILDKIAAQSKLVAQKESKRDKNELYYKKIKDLQIVVDLVNEAAVALEDSTRVITQSPTANALYIAGKGAGALGAGLSLAAMYSLGVPTLVSCFGTALALLGGTAVAGTFALAAAPVAILGAGGALVAGKAKKKHLIKEKKRLLTEVEKKNKLLNSALDKEKDASEERRQLLITLGIGLEKAQRELALDLARVGA